VWRNINNVHNVQSGFKISGLSNIPNHWAIKYSIDWEFLGNIFGHLELTCRAIVSTVNSTIHLQFDISANALEIRAAKSLKCIVWCAVDCTYECDFWHLFENLSSVMELNKNTTPTHPIDVVYSNTAPYRSTACGRIFALSLSL
jgi:hypothetical protein